MSNRLRLIYSHSSRTSNNPRASKGPVPSAKIVRWCAWGIRRTHADRNRGWIVRFRPSLSTDAGWPLNGPLRCCSAVEQYWYRHVGAEKTSISYDLARPFHDWQRLSLIPIYVVDFPNHFPWLKREKGKVEAWRLLCSNLIFLLIATAFHKF